MNEADVGGAGRHLWQAVSIPVHHSSPLKSTLTLSYKLPLGNPANPDLMKDALAEYVPVLPAWKYPVLGAVDSGQQGILGYMTVTCSAIMEHLYHTPSPMAQGPLQRRQGGCCKSQALGRTRVKWCLLDAARLLHSGAHSICAFPHQTCILAWRRRASYAPPLTMGLLTVGGSGGRKVEFS